MSRGGLAQPRFCTRGTNAGGKRRTGSLDEEPLGLRSRVDDPAEVAESEDPRGGPLLGQEPTGKAGSVLVEESKGPRPVTGSTESLGVPK